MLIGEINGNIGRNTLLTYHNKLTAVDIIFENGNNKISPIRAEQKE